MCTHTWERLADRKSWVCILCGLGPSEQPALGPVVERPNGEVRPGTPGTEARSPVAPHRRL